MEINRRQFGTLAAATAILGTMGIKTAQGADADTLVTADQVPTNLDPHQILDLPMLLYALNTYDTLYRYQNNPPELMPWLAESYTVSSDHLVWEFKLRPGMVFHDGSEITAEDVVYSFQRLMSLAKGAASIFLPILKQDSITAVDPHTVRFELTEAYGPFISAIPTVAIVNRRVLGPQVTNDDWGAAWLSSNEAGSGSYQLDASTYVPLERIDLTRFEDHFLGWDDNPAPVNKVAYRPAKESSTRLLGLMDGSIDWSDSYMPSDQIDQIAARDDLLIQQDESMRTFLIRMNNSRAPFDNINARKCFAHSFNYEGFIDIILKGYAKRSPTPMPTNMWGIPDSIEGYDFDLDKARMYYDKAVADGVDMSREFEIFCQPEASQTVQASQLLASDLSKLGIKLKLTYTTWTNEVAAAARADTTPDMWVHWVSTYFADPENWIGQMYDSQFHGTWKASAWYKNSTVDNLLRKARGLITQADRAPLYEEAITHIVEDCPDIWIYNTINVRGTSKRFSGFRFCPIGAGGEVRWLSVA